MYHSAYRQQLYWKVLGYTIIYTIILLYMNVRFSLWQLWLYDNTGFVSNQFAGLQQHMC